jgi:alpha-mannosidase
MRKRQSVAATLLLWGLMGAAIGATSAPASAAGPKDTFWLIPHTHWEGAVFKTREEYLESGLPNILKALRILEAHPEYRFVLDQVAYIRPFLERYPEEGAAFRRLVDEGRLGIVGGNIVMPDVNMPGGESWIRQALYGKEYCREKLGVDVKVGWAIDTFGHHAQMPQLLKAAGYGSYWFSRGVRDAATPAEFIWRGIDGSEIPAFWLPWGYAALYHAPRDAREFKSSAEAEFAALGPFVRGAGRVGLCGADVAAPEEHLPGMIAGFNRAEAAPFEIRFALPTDYEASVSKSKLRPMITGEMNPIFQGTYSSRIEIKQWIRTLETRLTDWEKLDALASWLGGATDTAQMAAAWDPMLFNQTHDLASGVMTDHVYEDTLRGYEFAARTAGEHVDNRLEYLVSKIDTTGKGTPIVVVNTLGWPRTDIVDVAAGVSMKDLSSLSLLDPAGRSVPFQTVGEERGSDGGLAGVRVAFVARDVPAVGWSVYRLVPAGAAASGSPADGIRMGPSRGSEHGDDSTIENDFFKAAVNLWTGEITGLTLKSDGWESLSGPANVVAREQDGGDFWELNGTLNGVRIVAMSRKVLLPRADRAQFSNEWVGGSGRTDAGPVISQFLNQHPFGNGVFETRVRMYAGVPRLDIRTRILNNDKLVRYRALFPTSIRKGTRFDEIPFGALERPSSEELPAQNWIDYSDGKHGLALLNRGLPGNNVVDGTLALSLMRSATIASYGFGGGYEPGMSSDSGLELGKDITFEYSLIPHAGDWRDAGITRAGMELNHPLLARKAGVHPGPLPRQWGILEIPDGNVVLSALKPGRNGTVVIRVYEAQGKPVKGAVIKFNARIASAEESNLIEASGPPFGTAGNVMRFEIHPYEIKTFKLRLEPAEDNR